MISSPAGSAIIEGDMSQVFEARTNSREDIREFLTVILGATALWAERRNFEAKLIRKVRRAVILRNHEHYVECIPVYRELAQERGLVDAPDIDDVSNELMFTTDLFKSYDPRWLDTEDYGQMTEWLGTIFVRSPRIGLAGVRDLRTWRQRLRQDGVYLTHSGGTSGRLSFVPRDDFTLSALRGNSRFYSRSIAPLAEVQERGFDCLVLGPRGTGMGIQAAATGLARAARRSHFVFDYELDPDMVRSALPRSGPDRWPAPKIASRAPLRDEAYGESMRFLQQPVAATRPVVVFGTPAEVLEICSWIEHENVALTLPQGSAVISGGGWKDDVPGRISHDELAERIQRSFGVPADHVVDTYSTSECNFYCMRCWAGRYHVPPLVEVVILDDALMPVRGEDVYGLIGFLDPFATCYPGYLITGDEGHAVSADCPCGLSGWSFVGDITRASSFESKGCGGVMRSVTA
jgi:Acyl-protein synthetase, LuxE